MQVITPSTPDVARDLPAPRTSSSSSSSSVQPVLSYAGSTVGAGVMLREDGAGGHEFIVSPPPVARLLIGPAIVVLALTPFGACAAAGLVLALVSVLFNPGPALIGAAVAAVFLSLWVIALRTLVGVARLGRTPFVLRMSPRGFSVTGAFKPDASTTCDTFEHRSPIRIELRPSSGDPFYRVARLRILYSEERPRPASYSFDREPHPDDPREFHFPWPSDESIAEWDRVLREQLIVPRRQQNGADLACGS